jgi:hypothetical protein
MQEVMKEIQEKELRIYIVWLPALRTDNRAAALERSEEFTDPRLRQYWDGEQTTGISWNGILKTGQLAWDVYMIFARGRKWGKDPPMPDFWMHQLRGIESAPRLDRYKFASKVMDLIQKK